MSWLKKNLSLVVGGVVALGLLGFAIFFLLMLNSSATYHLKVFHIHQDSWG